MLYYLAVLLAYALLTFGAVLPDKWLSLTLLWLLGFAIVLITRTIKSQRISDVVFAFTLGGACLLLVGGKPAGAILVGCWGWLGGKSPTAKILKFFNILIGIGLLEALLGFVQFFISPRWILGYTGIDRSSGTLINRNHFAGLLGLLVPLCLGLAYIGMRRFGDRARSYVYLLAGAFIATSLIFSLSRSGIFSFLTTLLLLALVVAMKDTRATLATGLGLGMLSMVIIGAVWIGVDIIVDRYSVLLKEETLRQDSRMAVYADTLKLIKAHPGGVGSGNYQDSFRRYQTYRPELLFDHAHNDYLETAAEFGVVGALGIWGAIFSITGYMVLSFLRTHSPERAGLLLGCIGSTLSILIHSLTDFNLQIPSNFLLFFAILGIGLAISQTTRKQVAGGHEIDLDF